MRKILAWVVLTTAVVTADALSPSILLAQPRHPPEAGRAEPKRAEPRRQAPPRGEPRRPTPRPPVRRDAVVFVGGYFYDPFFGPYPWWNRPAYPFGYWPQYASRAVLRVLATPEDAAVYVDGFYAGVVDDFNGYFQGLPLPPGSHEIVLYLDGYRTVHRPVYLAAGTTFKLRENLILLPPASLSEPPTLAPPLPPPPEGSYLPPRTAPRMPSPAGPLRPPAMTGTLTLLVDPVAADVRIDGDRWVGSGHGRFVIHLLEGAHQIEVTSPGYRPYSTEIRVQDGGDLTLTVSLVRGQT